MKTQKNICICQGCGNEHDLNEDLSPLYEHAHELLEACKAALSCMAPDDNDYTARKLRNAIAKAEGRAE